MKSRAPLLGIFFFLWGCSPTAVGRQTMAAHTLARTWNRAILPTLEDAYTLDQLNALHRVCPPERPGACLRDVAEAAVAPVHLQWAPVWPASEALRETHEAWRVELELCRPADPSGDAGACAPSLGRHQERFLRAVTAVRCAIRAARHAELDKFGLPEPDCSAPPVELRDGGVE